MTLLVSALIFAAVGVGFLLVNMLVGQLVRPHRPDAEKQTIYECGEPTVGSSWIQFDLRFYVVALLFVVFDVEVALLVPWALVFGTANQLADPALDADQRVALTAKLSTGPAEAVPVAEAASAAHRFAWLAFADLLVFFGVLLVGFAYLWKRGDLDWVRSTAAQEKG